MNLGLLYAGEGSSDIVKYIVYTGDNFNTYAQALGITAFPEIIDILTAFSVPNEGGPGMVQVEVTICSKKKFVRNIINVDSTDDSSFWTDIRNYLYSENTFDFEVDTDIGPTFGWQKILDPKNNTLIILRQVI